MSILSSLWPVAAFGLVGFAFLYFVVLRSSWREKLGDTGDLDTHLDLSHPALGAGYRQGPVMGFTPDKRTVTLTRRDLEHINIYRRQHGTSPLSMNGFLVAVSACRNREMWHGNWITYLSLCAITDTRYHSSRVAVDEPITIRIDGHSLTVRAGDPYAELAKTLLR